MFNQFFTSESVTNGHPDKVCDQISDAVLDEIIGQDPNARVACETAATTGMTLIMGEITTSCYADIPAVVRRTIKEIGYTNPDYGLDYNTCAVLTAIDEQSPDIAMGVDASAEYKAEGEKNRYDLIGAGDQGMMFGFACTETPVFMPAPIYYARKLTNRLTEVREKGICPFVRPDGKSQVTVEYAADGKVKRIDTVVLSTQHHPEIELEDLRKEVLEKVIRASLPEELLDKDTKYFINPTGRFVIGGPHGDSGLTGRKIIVDTYGGYARHGGGAFSGKDPTKVDRSAAYMARYVAKNIVAAGLADKCELEVSYAIGVANPMSVAVETFGTGKLSDEKISKIVREVFELRPAGIIDTLDLRRPIYKNLAAHGHFGWDNDEITWERTDKKEELQKYL